MKDSYSTIDQTKMSLGNGVDKFGRKMKTGRIIVKGGRGVGSKLSPHGDYDMQTRKLINVGEPDGATVNYVDDMNMQTKEVVLQTLQQALSTTFDVINSNMENLGKKFSEQSRMFDKRLDAVEVKQLSLNAINNKIEDIDKKFLKEFRTFDRRLDAIDTKELNFRITQNTVLVSDCLEKIASIKSRLAENLPKQFSEEFGMVNRRLDAVDALIGV